VRAYIERIERETECKVELISVGPDREQTIAPANPFVL
jgi:adenylosuccinate synthase